VTAIAVAPDGSWLATGGVDRTARIWDSATGRERAVLNGHSGWVTAIAVAPDSSWLATTSNDGTTRIWDTTGRETAVLKGRVAVTPEGSWLATTSSDGTMRIWNPATERPEALMRVDGQLWNCAWLGPGMLAASGSAGQYLFRFLPGTATPAAAH
jgi:WD40 repeat protein